VRAMKGESVVSTSEAARLLGLAKTTVRWAIRAGRLRAVDVAPPGSAMAVWAIPLSEIERYRREHLGQRKGGRPRKTGR
jgi:excisionase family DNA binding protein